MSVLCASANGYYFPTQPRTAAAGVEADALSRCQLHEVIKFPARQRLLSELAGLVDDQESIAWYGEGATPVSKNTLEPAARFLADLPAGFLDLEISPDEDGAVSFDWYGSDNKQLSVSLDEHGTLYYAAILGPIERVSGRLPFHDSIPEEIIRLLKRTT